MQRRAAAGYAAFFLIVGIVAFSLIATATPPELTFQNPDHELRENDTVPINGTTYNVSSLDAELEEAEGEGGGTTLVRSATLTANKSVRQTATWANGSEVTYRNTTWTVRPTNGTTATLTEVIDREAILRNDATVENETQTIDGVEYVVRVDGNATLIRADEFFPEPATTTVSEDDEIRFDGRTVLVERVDRNGTLLTWTAIEQREEEVTNDGNVTVDGVTYYAQFPDNETLLLSQNFERLADHRDSEARFSTHENGLWGVTLLSGATLVFLVGLSFLPSRY